MQPSISRRRTSAKLCFFAQLAGLDLESSLYSGTNILEYPRPLLLIAGMGLLRRS